MTEQEPMGEGKLVFVVDADPSVRETLRTLLERFVAGVRVVELADGLEVMGELAARRPDLILLEVDDCLEEDDRADDNLGLLRALKANSATSGLAVVGLGYPSGDGLAAREAGCDEYLDRPWDLDRLVASVRRLLGMAAPS